MATEEMFLPKQHLHFAGDIFRRFSLLPLKSFWLPVRLVGPRGRFPDQLLNE